MSVSVCLSVCVRESVYVCVSVCVCTLKMMLLCVQVSLELALSPGCVKEGKMGGRDYY